MNSYNENLHSSVLETLQSQELDLKKINSQTNAAMYALYYAQDATFTATDKLEDAKAKQADAEKRKKQAVDNSNISTNLLLSANQANQYQKQSVTNAAVAAANVQIAANAILRLAGDMGNVMGILGASNHHTEIADHAEIAKRLINDTAKVAEAASQFAMEASMLTAQVSAPALLDKAKNANSSMTDLLKIISSDYDAKSQVVSTDNASLATVSVKEKQAEGVYEDTDTINNAANLAYSAINNALNLGLTATVADGVDSSTTFKVQFECIRSPFFNHVSQKALPDVYEYPVEHYYLFVVRETQKNTFLISDADNIKQNYPQRFILLDNFFQAPFPIVPDDGQVKHWFNHNFNYDNITNANTEIVYKLFDSDGLKIETGVNYTVFIVAEFTKLYKSTLNTFDDFLSAPSQPFCFNYILSKANNIAQKTEAIPPSTFEVQPPVVPKKLNLLSFNASQDLKHVTKVSYRCIFLPVSAAMLANDSSALKGIDNRIFALEEDLKKINLQISIVLNDSLLKREEIMLQENGDNIHWLIALDKLLNSGATSVNEELKNLVKQFMNDGDQKYQFAPIEEKDVEGLPIAFLNQLSNNLDDTWIKVEALQHLGELPKIERKLFNLEINNATPSDAVKAFIKLLLWEYIDSVKMNSLTGEREVTEKGINDLQAISKTGFRFNIKLAEQVSPGNFTPAYNPNTDSKEQFEVKIDSGTTDNFGNLLSLKRPYIPVILSVYSGDEVNEKSYTNSWTGCSTTNYFFLQDAN